MARTARAIGVSGYYHLIIRGNSRQILFEDREDYQVFLGLLRKFSIDTEVTICAYCLMDNHVHLLVHDALKQKSKLMHRLEFCYAGYFNHKYDRCGHLFQGRYRCEVIESERYLLAVFHYIMNNPVKAGLCAVDEYEWSSYHLYHQSGSFVDTSMFYTCIGEWDAYQDFMHSASDVECLEYGNKRLTDGEALEIIQNKLGVKNGQVVLTYSREDRNAAIRILLQEGLSQRQIERMTGVGRGVIQKLIL